MMFALHLRVYAYAWSPGRVACETHLITFTKIKSLLDADHMNTPYTELPSLPTRSSQQDTDRLTRKLSLHLITSQIINRET